MYSAVTGWMASSDCDPQDVGGADGGEQKEHCEAACRMANPELLGPQAAAELRSAWAGEAARPHTGASYTSASEN